MGKHKDKYGNTVEKGDGWADDKNGGRFRVNEYGNKEYDDYDIKDEYGNVTGKGSRYLDDEEDRLDSTFGY